MFPTTKQFQTTAPVDNPVHRMNLHRAWPMPGHSTQVKELLAKFHGYFWVIRVFMGCNYGNQIWQLKISREMVFNYGNQPMVIGYDYHN
jgi:hypothetical protein